jgi:EF-hand domain pair
MSTEKETAFVNIDALFRLLDRDGDGVLSWAEFLSAVGNSISLEFPQQHLHDLVFEIIDSVRNVGDVVGWNCRTSLQHAFHRTSQARCPVMNCLPFTPL